MSLFIRLTPLSTTCILIYVDDISVTENSSQYITELVSQLDASFTLKDMSDLHYFLCIEVKHNAEGGFYCLNLSMFMTYLRKLRCKVANHMLLHYHPHSNSLLLVVHHLKTLPCTYLLLVVSNMSLSLGQCLHIA